MGVTKEVLIVLNGYVFFKTIGSDLPELHQVLVEMRHRVNVLLTNRLIIAYERIARGRALPLSELQSLLQRAREKYTIERKAGKKPDNIPGAAQHKEILEEALAAKADYLLTEWDRWLRLGKRLKTDYDLVVTTPHEFLNEVAKG